MREVVMDTETTGLDPYQGHKIVEIGAVELLNHIPTGRTFHKYINPRRVMPKEAFDVHGLDNEFLKGKPVFKDIAEMFLDFIEESTLVIHNANFDIKFLNHELESTGFETLKKERVLDTLALARKKFPGSPASLDALSRRFKVDLSKREKHGALLDSEILAVVYLELIGGRQPDLILSSESESPSNKSSTASLTPLSRENVLPTRLTLSEMEAHKVFLKSFGSEALWNKFSS